MSGCPVKQDSVTDKSSSSCPVKPKTEVKADVATTGSYIGYFQSLFYPKGEVASPSKDITGYNAAANDAHFGQQRLDGQKIPLSTKREVSTIPKGDFTPEHQPQNAEKWIYPSEQQYFTAMKRKGYDPEEKDVPVILAIHNLVNERGWTQVQQWEAFRGCQSPKLKRFLGRPTDISPKAYLRSFMGYSLPFDRHDWIIDRGDGKEVRYVIDFYKGADRQINAPISIFLDVRPALDSLPALFDRVYVGAAEIFGVQMLPSLKTSPPAGPTFKQNQVKVPTAPLLSSSSSVTSTIETFSNNKKVVEKK